MKTYSKIVVLFLVIIVFHNCKTIPSSVVEENNYYEVVFKSQIGGKIEKSNQVITNYEDFNFLISELSINEEDYSKLLKIDLEKYNLLVYFMGEKNTGGYDVDLESVKFLPNSTEVKIKETLPEKNAMVTMVTTSPYLFVVLPKEKQIVVK